MRAGEMRAEPRRRNRSRQRERLLAVLRGTTCHPTAAWLHEMLREQFPRLSLGTVYRNLDVLVAEGRIDEVPDTDGVRRFDGNTLPHHHFACVHCGAIQDVDLPVPRGLAGYLRRNHGVVPHQVSIHCRGLCQDCATGEPGAL